MLKLLASTYYNASEISAQEAAYNLLGIRMVESSVLVVFVPTSRPENQIHFLKSQASLGKMDPESTNCFVDGLVEHYSNRPEELDASTLSQFASYFEIRLIAPSKKKKKSELDLEVLSQDANEDPVNDLEGNEDVLEEMQSGIEFGPAGRVYRLNNNSGFICRRSKPRVIRYYKFNIDREREDYFKTLLMLYHPWTNEAIDLLNKNAESVFNDNSESIVAMKYRFSKVNDDTLDGYLDHLQAEIDRRGEEDTEVAEGN